MIARSTADKVSVVLAELGLGIHHGYDRATDCEYWYVSAGGRDGPAMYQSLNWLDCADWVTRHAARTLELEGGGVC